MPGKGSGRVLSFTKAATTVLGMVAVCQPFGANVGVEMTSPLASTLAEVCSAQPSCSISLVSPVGFIAGLAGAFCWAGSKELKKICARRKKEKNSGLPDFMVLLCRCA